VWVTEALPQFSLFSQLCAPAQCCYWTAEATVDLLDPREQRNMRYLHTMLRVRNLDAALKFYRDALGLKEVRRVDNDKAKFTLVFLCAPEDKGLLKASKGRGAPLVELTYNWDEEKYGEDRYFGHLAYEVDDIYATCERLMKLGVTINRPPRDGQMAFVRSPDLHSIELLQKGGAKPAAEPWASMSNTGHW
jgi:lactoylglutathione lyase